MVPYNELPVPLTASILDDVLAINEGLHKCGTFGPRALTALAGHLSRHDITYSAETGSGSSTLLFSHCSELHTVFSADHGGSVANVKASPLLRPEHVVWVEGPTQLTLPAYQFRHKLQAALLDGPHGYPFPDLEYYYLYQQLETGALLIIDDIQIPTIHNLFEFLRKEEMFALDEIVDTTAFFTRTDAPTFCPIEDGWWLQGYNKTPLTEVCPQNYLEQHAKSAAARPRFISQMTQRFYDIVHAATRKNS
jgi:hypothetical protein